MASSKVLCVVCNKGKGSFKCEGCSQMFCPKHANDHRNELSKQLEDIGASHDLVQQTLIQQTEDPYQHPLLKQIDQWEKDSIVKIRQTAKEAKYILLRTTVKYTIDIKRKLKCLSDDLRQARDDNDFMETDLQQWMRKVEELKKEVLNPETITVQEDSTTLVANIRINSSNVSDVFERAGEKVRIEDNGLVAVFTTGNDHTEVRGKNDYTTGRYILRFQVEQLRPRGWIFFGIISKSEPMKAQSYGCASSYGWSNLNQVFIAGIQSNGQTMKIIQNDNIVLLIDCDQRTILMTNERSNRTQEIPIDINKCSFPWQFHLDLHAANTRVRILTVSD